VLNGLEEIEQYRAMAAWEKTTATGDRAELAELPETSALWHKLDARADACIGQKCSEWERCFVTEMRRRGMESDIIVVNHHLFFADLAIKLQADGAPDAGILPEAAAVIFDEAHELEDVAGNYFGISISNLRVEDLAREVEAALQYNRMLSASISGALGSLRERAQVFFSLLPPGEGRFAFETRREFLEENGDEFLATRRPTAETAGDFQLRSARPGTPGSTELRDGIGRSQHRILDRAARWKNQFATEKQRHGDNRKAKRFPSSYANRCWSNPARMPLVEARMRGPDFRYARRRGRLRIYTAAAWVRTCPRVRAAVTLRL
jgi:ATP-dependent DNA helicase DinG